MQRNDNINQREAIFHKCKVKILQREVSISQMGSNCVTVFFTKGSQYFAKRNTYSSKGSQYTYQKEVNILQREINIM